MKPAFAFCLGCRAMLDRNQACECPGAPRHVALDNDAADTINEALHVEPQTDWSDTQQRLIASLFYGPGGVLVVFWLFAIALWTVWPTIEQLWPYVLGIPWGIVTLIWVAFFLYSEASQRRPYYRHGQVRPKPEATENDEVGAIESGRIVALEMHQQRKADQPVIRDAFIESDLVLRRTSEKITVPAGRIELVLPEDRWRQARASAVLLWPKLPEAIWRAGMLMEAKTRVGEEITLIDGVLEEVDASEGTFRQAAERQLRWVPRSGRVRVQIGKR